MLEYVVNEKYGGENLELWSVYIWSGLLW